MPDFVKAEDGAVTSSVLFGYGSLTVYSLQECARSALGLSALLLATCYTFLAQEPFGQNQSCPALGALNAGRRRASVQHLSSLAL